MTTYSKSQPEPDCWGIAWEQDGQTYTLPFYSEEARDDAWEVLMAEEVSA